MFRKKPVVIEAVQWNGHGDHEEVRRIAPTDDLYFTGMGGTTLVNRDSYGVIGTLESPGHLVSPGDWIIRGVQGELYACKPDVFAMTYEPAVRPPQQPAKDEAVGDERQVLPAGWRVSIERGLPPMLGMPGVMWMELRGPKCSTSDQAGNHDVKRRIFERFELALSAKPEQGA
jgi:hypothetical protein